MHDTSNESEFLGQVSPVLPNVVSGCDGVLPHKLADIRGLREDVGGVPQLRDFDDNGARQLEYELIAKVVNVLAAFLQLQVEVRVVVWLPTELRNIEIGRHSKAPAKSRQFLFIQWLVGESGSNLLDG